MKKKRKIWIWYGLVLFLFSSLLLGLEHRFLLIWDQFKNKILAKTFALSSPPQTEPVLKNTGEIGRLRNTVKNLKGFIVWSSNRTSNHEIWLMTLPDLFLKQLTHHPNADTFPRISRDGTRILFCRSHKENASQRDAVPWDVYIMDIKTQHEQLMAKDSFAPSWSNKGEKIYFEKEVTQFWEKDLQTGEEKMLFKSGMPPVPGNIRLESPSFNEKEQMLAVTLRGSMRRQMLFSLKGEKKDAGGGCQIAWSPKGDYLYYVDKGGKKGTSFYKLVPGTGEVISWFDSPGAYSHDYFPSVSFDGNYLVYASSEGGHEHDRADYEIFLWKINSDPYECVRVTYHSANDCWPDMWLEREKIEN
ncbi:MAG: PD40 domain-containing protein [Candidatus Aureabacteria bacterium]|nr:PD40 domain-containing protein [Candidatus Auribacterota bacterium]